MQIPQGGERMKDVRMSFAVTVALQQTDVHWLEAELLRQRQAKLTSDASKSSTLVEPIRKMLVHCLLYLVSKVKMCPLCGTKLMNR